MTRSSKRGLLAVVRRDTSAVRRARRAPELIDPETAWYRDWYFMSRLQDEVLRSRQFGLPLALIVMRSRPTSEVTSRSVSAFLSMRLALAREDLRVSDVPGRLTESEFAVYLPHSGEEHARTLVERLRQEFTGLLLSFGVAVYPGDAVTAEGLLETARRDADNVGAKIVDLAAYRARRLWRQRA